MKPPSKVVFLFDVDNTLLDNDRMVSLSSGDTVFSRKKYFLYRIYLSSGSHARIFQ